MLVVRPNSSPIHPYLRKDEKYSLSFRFLWLKTRTKVVWMLIATAFDLYHDTYC